MLWPCDAAAPSWPLLRLREACPRGTRFCPPTSIASSADIPCRLGATVHRRGSELLDLLQARDFVHAWCCSNPERRTSLATFPLDPHTNRTGQVWHIFVEGLDAGAHYGYRFDMEPNPESQMFIASILPQLLLDPYARVLSDGAQWGTFKAGSRPYRTRRGDREPFRLGARSAAEYSAGRQRHLRDARAQLHPPSFVRRRESRHLRRTDRKDSLPQAARRDRRRVASGERV